MRRLASYLMTLAVAAPAALLTAWLGVPLAWLIGPLMAIAAVSMLGLRPGGLEFAMPPWARPACIPVIGVAIGATVTPEIIGHSARWWPTLLAVPFYLLVVQFANYALLRRFGGFDRPTAFFSASPGGLIDAVMLGEMRGGALADMSSQHFLRIVLTVVAAPFLSGLFATPVAAPVVAAVFAAPPAVALGDALLLLGCAVVGATLGLRVKLPAAMMLGPFLLSAALHVTGVVEIGVPPVLVHLAQLAVGATLGLRFRGVDHRRLAKGFVLSGLCVALALAIAGALAWALAPAVGVPGPAVFLAFAPGGVAEMSLVAVALGAEPAFVVAHHLLRIVLTVSLASVIYDRIILRGRI